jgi:hypothetical protein
MNFKWLLSGVFTFFIAVLVVCYIISKQANPVFLDEHGKPVATAKSGY